MVQRPVSRARRALRCRRVDHHLMVSERSRGVLVPLQEQHYVPPATAQGEGPRGREFTGLDLPAEATEQARRGACILRSATR